MDENDQEQLLFVKAFAEPTHTYRKLAEYRKEHPLQLFLHRNLSYVRCRKWRTKKTKRRSSGRIHSISSTIDKLVERKRGAQHFITFTFHGILFDEETDGKQFSEIQITHKNSDSNLTSIILDVNPKETSSNRASVISFPTDSLGLTSASGELLTTTKSCIVTFTMQLLGVKHETVRFETELELFNEASQGLIDSGHYELELVKMNNDLHKQISPSKRPAWQLKFMHDRRDSNEEKSLPVLKFHVQWSKHLTIEQNAILKFGGTTGGGSAGARRILTRSHSTGSIFNRSISFVKSNETVTCLVYQFIHNNFRQKTEVWDRLKCPWCVQRSHSIYNLLKHLSLCHDRFKFKYAPTTHEIRIDVMVNKKTEDLRKDPFSRHGTNFDNTWPVKRATHTGFLVFRPDRYRPRLAEFFWNFDGELFGRKRTYYHSSSGLTVRPNELDTNSEDETDPLWLQQHIVRLIDDFVDVNDGEKEIMKMWNLHVLANNYLCDTQMASAIASFVQKYGEQILQKNLYRNCMIHITNLCDFGLIASSDAYNSIAHFQQILVNNHQIRQIVVDRAREQRIVANQPKPRVALVPRKLPKENLLETPRRKSDRMLMKKRLRSHSLLAMRATKVHRPNEPSQMAKEFMIRRGARKSAPNFNFEL